jgi:hypothetical protein
MAINYTWDVSKVDTYPTKSSRSDVVYNVHWRLTGIDGSNNDSDGNPQRSSLFGTQLIDTSDLTSFTAFGSLNSSTVQGWVETALGSSKVTELKAKISADITEKVTPTSVLKTLGS